MREVSIRQFQRSMHNELRDLPVCVTRNGEPSFVVMDYKHVPEYITPIEPKPDPNNLPKRKPKKLMERIEQLFGGK